MELWLCGLKFLWKEKKYWPEQPFQLLEVPGDNSECEKRSGSANMIIHGRMLEDPLLSQYSSWDSLQKAIACLVRSKSLVGSISKEPESITKGLLTVAKVIAAERVDVKAVLHGAFPAELPVVDQRPC